MVFVAASRGTGEFRLLVFHHGPCFKELSSDHVSADAFFAAPLALMCFTIFPPSS